MTTGDNDGKEKRGNCRKGTYTKLQSVYTRRTIFLEGATIKRGPQGKGPVDWSNDDYFTERRKRHARKENSKEIGPNLKPVEGSQTDQKTNKHHNGKKKIGYQSARTNERKSRWEKTVPLRDIKESTQRLL